MIKIAALSFEKLSDLAKELFFLLEVSNCSLILVSCEQRWLSMNQKNALIVHLKEIGQSCQCSFIWPMVEHCRAPHRKRMMMKGFGEMSIRSLACKASLMSRMMTEKPRIANMTCKKWEITGN